MSLTKLNQVIQQHKRNSALNLKMRPSTSAGESTIDRNLKEKRRSGKNGNDTCKGQGIRSAMAANRDQSTGKSMEASQQRMQKSMKRSRHLLRAVETTPSNNEYSSYAGGSCPKLVARLRKIQHKEKVEAIENRQKPCRSVKLLVTPAVRSMAELPQKLRLGPLIATKPIHFENAFIKNRRIRNQRQNITEVSQKEATAQNNLFTQPSTRRKDQAAEARSSHFKVPHTGHNETAETLNGTTSSHENKFTLLQISAEIIESRVFLSGAIDLDGSPQHEVS